MAKKHEVLIADDHRLVREGICKLLDFFDNYHVVGEAEDGLEAVSKVRDKFPDLVLLDLNMPRMNGIDAIHKIKEISPKIKVIILTIHDDEEYVYRVTSAGAEGFIQKDLTSGELREALDEVMNGGTVFPRTLEPESEEDEQSDTTDYRELLSDREYEVLTLLARGMSNRRIAEELYISEKTVKNHVSNLLRKLDVNDRTQAVITALKKGLVTLS
ncbi:response regulator [Halarsenatibacter silvermanii]|uniref:Stage 0 sporulation protein A homolog n=1 Tax=Halarsenatibacter silvermanii TaxID=321763 RepID=A0A1G9GYP7_9FIRM|nr:response regulator transcription factor [Halarsenatibacter silvermanii]SDL05779.1 two component transcriptional regulator, LuxR family [Halarsenatibacter silvermanii]